MPAVIRRSQARGVARKAAARGGAASKLKGAGGVGLDHRAALGVALGVLALLVCLLLATGGRFAALGAAVANALDERLAAVGFRVGGVMVEGGSTLSAADVLRAAGVRRGAPLFGINLEDVRERVEAVGWIKSAKVIRLWPDTVVIAVAERPRLAVWQHGAETRVVDKDGQIIPEADPAGFPDLPLVVGEGANEAAGAILPELSARPGLMNRLEALIRVDGRRWDIRLKDGALVQLPAGGEDSALIQFDQLEQRSHLLEEGFERIDLRDPEMVAVRPRTPEPVLAPAEARAGL